MKVDDAIANAFVKEGTTTVFGLLGDGQLTWWSAMAALGVEMIDARDEGASLAMADGWARASGRTGVCSVTQGPGITRIATSLVTATRYRTPVVVHTAATGFNKDNAMQVLDQEKLVSATGAGYIEILTPDFAEAAVRQAFYRARLEGRPMVLSVPLDLQKKECDAQGDAYEPSSKMFPRQQRIRGDAERLAEAVGLIAQSRKPVVMVGRGAMCQDAQAAIRKLAKRIGALIVPTLHAKGALGDDEYYAGIGGLFSTRTLVQLAGEADCVVALGTSMNNYAVQVRGKGLFPNARVVHVDVAPHLLMGTGKGADCYIQGDAVLTAIEIEEKLAAQGFSKEGFRTSAVRRALLDASRDPTECEIEPGTVDPREAARILDEHLPSNVGVVVGDGHFMSFPIMLMKKPRNVHVFSTAFGSIGQGLGTAIGAAVATREPMLCVEGDGGALQNIQELDTARRLGLKLLYVVMNDDAYGAEYHKLKVKKLGEHLAAVQAPDFGAVGQGFGCRGRTARSIEEIARATDDFLAGEGPMVLDVRISRNVVSIPYRRMHLGQDV
jgi:thiamine pyrophosphate-dependent acetolactate synthase large subunit-like protein